MNSRTWPWVVATCASFAVAATVGVAWWLRGPEQALVWATILALLPVGFAFFGWARAATLAPSTSTPDQVEAAARMLAGQVDRQWREEAGRRGLTDPEPLAVRWKSAPRPLGDHPRLAGEISGRSDEVARLADRFLRLPHRRLVVLGPPGAGKTSLAVLLTLELCRRYRESGELAPVLLSAASWNPNSEHMHAWVERQLNLLYPALRAADYGPTAARSLLAAGRVLPILDGLDELTEASRAEALRRINEALREGGPLVLTCRTDDFEAALQGVDVLTGAAVIEAAPVRLGDAEAFLLEAVPPASPATRSWRALLARARGMPDGPLAAALSNPLRVWLIRVVYADSGRDPEELAEVPDAAAMEDMLLGAVIPAVFEPARQGSQAARIWDPLAAQRWLSFLATHLDRLGTRDLAWWRLRGTAPAIVRLLVFGLLVGLLDELLVRTPPLTDPGGRVLVAVMLGLVFALLGVFQDAEQRPARRPLHPLVVWVLSGVAVGLMVAGPGAVIGQLDLMVLFFAVGVAAGVGVGLISWLTSRVWPAFQPTRRWKQSLGPGIAVVLVIGALSWLGIGPLFSDPLIGLLVWLVGALLVRYLGPKASPRVTQSRGRSSFKPIAVWTVAGFAIAWADAFWGYAVPFLGGFAYGILAGLLPPQRPGRATLTVRGRRQVILQVLGAPLVALPAVVLMALFRQLLGRSSLFTGPVILLVSVLSAVLLPVITAIAVTRLVQTPLTSDRATSPRATLRDDRTLTLITGPLVALVAGPLVAAPLILLVGIVGGIFPIPGARPGSFVGNLETGLGLGLVCGLAALAFGLGRPWLSYMIARAWLALWGRLPWRLMTFLDDAHRLGLLRQVGPVYQFRHAGLQDRLARPRQEGATDEVDEVNLERLASS